jgi:hypothetical protein
VAVIPVEVIQVDVTHVLVSKVPVDVDQVSDSVDIVHVEVLPLADSSANATAPIKLDANSVKINKAFFVFIFQMINK